MRKGFLFLVCLFLIAPVAQSGVRIINNGGGFAEMRALTALARLKLLIAPCVARPQLCGLSDQEHHLLSRQLSEGFFETYTHELEFFAADTSIPSRLSPKQKILLNSKTLYDDSNQPKSYQEIARLVFIAWYRETFADIVPDLSKKIFRHFLVRENEVSLEVEGRSLRSYTMQSMVDPNGRDAVLIYETKDGSQDLTPLLVAAMKCPEPPKILDIAGFAYEHPVVTSSVTWECGKVRHQAHFSVHTSVLKVNIYNISSCEDELK